MAETAFTVNPNPFAAPFICGFDGSTHESLDALHDYLKRWRLARAKYYQTYYPRYDLGSGEPIVFKDIEQYFEQDFLNKNTLKKWLKENPEKGYEWSKQWLALRKKKKGLIYPPSQTELRTLCCPSMPYYNKVGAKEGGYYNITASLGYKQRFNTDLPVFTKLPNDAQIIRDTREQLPISLSVKTINDTVNVGDYALAAPYDIGVRIERKSLADFCGTLSERKVKKKGGRKKDGCKEDSSYQRFDRELARAQEQNLYVVMIVEININDAQGFNYLPQTQWIKASPSYIFRNLRELLIKYPLNFQCLFVDGRIEMARVIVKLFEMGDQVKTCDLQFHYEEGRI